MISKRCKRLGQCFWMRDVQYFRGMARRMCLPSQQSEKQRLKQEPYQCSNWDSRIYHVVAKRRHLDTTDESMLGHIQIGNPAQCSVLVFARACPPRVFHFQIISTRTSTQGRSTHSSKGPLGSCVFLSFLQWAICSQTTPGHYKKGQAKGQYVRRLNRLQVESPGC